jgi:hypothetical protein
MNFKTLNNKQAMGSHLQSFLRPVLLMGFIDEYPEKTIHSTYANILKNRYKKVRKNVGIG